MRTIALFAFCSLCSLCPAATLVTSDLPRPAGTLLATSHTRDIPLYSKVYANDPDSPLGGLTFAYQVATNAELFRPVTELEVTGFAGVTVDAGIWNIPNEPFPNDWRPPTSIVRNDDSIVFTWSPAIQPGLGSDYLLLRTNATEYRASTMRIDWMVPVSVAGLAPVAVPEPGTWVLFGLGSMFLARIRRK